MPADNGRLCLFAAIKAGTPVVSLEVSHERPFKPCQCSEEASSCIVSQLALSYPYQKTVGKRPRSVKKAASKHPKPKQAPSKGIQGGRGFAHGGKNSREVSAPRPLENLRFWWTLQRNDTG